MDRQEIRNVVRTEQSNLVDLHYQKKNTININIYEDYDQDLQVPHPRGPVLSKLLSDLSSRTSSSVKAVFSHFLSIGNQSFLVLLVCRTAASSNSCDLGEKLCALKSTMNVT